MGASASLDGRLLVERRVGDDHQFAQHGNTIVMTRMVRTPGGTAGSQALFVRPTLDEARAINDNYRRSVYPAMPSNSTDRMVMLMEALVEFLETVEGNLQHCEEPRDNRTPHAILNRLPCRKADASDADNECYICLNHFEEGEDVRTLPCNHAFHSSCVDRWLLDVHHTCPCCRLDICAPANDEPRDPEDEARARQQTLGNMGNLVDMQSARRGGPSAMVRNSSTEEITAVDAGRAAESGAQRAQGTGVGRVADDIGDAGSLVTPTSSGVGHTTSTSVSLDAADERAAGAFASAAAATRVPASTTGTSDDVMVVRPFAADAANSRSVSRSRLTADLVLLCLYSILLPPHSYARALLRSSCLVPVS